MKQRISIGADPGTANYGYSVLSFSKKKEEQIKFRVLEIGMFVDTVSNLTSKPAKPPKSKRRKTKPMVMIPAFRKQFRIFLREWDNMIDTYQPIKITMERYQARGLRGSTIESVTLMNGGVAVLAQQKRIDFEIFLAASWKNQVNKLIDLKEDIYGRYNLPDHIIDSVFINVHGVLNRYSLKWTDVNIQFILDQLECYTYEK